MWEVHLDNFLAENGRQVTAGARKTGWARWVSRNAGSLWTRGRALVAHFVRMAEMVGGLVDLLASDAESPLIATKS